MDMDKEDVNKIFDIICFQDLLSQQLLIALYKFGKFDKVQYSKFKKSYHLHYANSIYRMHYPYNITAYDRLLRRIKALNCVRVTKEQNRLYIQLCPPRPRYRNNEICNTN